MCCRFKFIVPGASWNPLAGDSVNPRAAAHGEQLAVAGCATATTLWDLLPWCLSWHQLRTLRQTMNCVFAGTLSS